MKHTINKTTDSHVSLEVELDGKDLQPAKAAALRQLAPTAKAPGFRQGKVPADVAEKHLDPNQVAQGTAELAINQAVNALAETEDLRILDQPQIDMKEFVPGQSLKFTAEIDVLPPIKLGDYKALKAKPETKKVEAKDVDRVIERMRAGMSEKAEVKRAAKDGDEVKIDFIGKQDGVAFDGGSATDYDLALGSKSFIPGFEEAIVGHKVGQEFEVPLSFPKDYHAEQLKGQKVIFEVKLKSVQEVKLPELNDEFAKKCGPFDDVKQLRADVEREVTQQNQQQSDEKLKDDLIGELVEKSTVPTPEVLVNDQMKSIETDARQNLQYRGQDLKQYLTVQGFDSESDWREKELAPQAKRRVQAGLILSELSKLEKIDVTKAELDERLEGLKQQYPNMISQFDAPEARRDLANRVITEKTVDRLVELNSKK